MTLIAGFSDNQKSFIISDLRLTKNEVRHQLDRTLKFIALDKRIGLFPSGNVNFWKVTIPKLSEIVNLVTYDNIMDINEPFWQELSKSAGNYEGKVSGAICFILCPETKKHRMLKIIIDPGNGALLSLIEEKKTEIIGSGANIPNLNTKLDSSYEQIKKFYKGDTYCIASSFRTEIKNHIKKYGSSTYRKLGISPIMTVSILQEDYFCVCGEEGQGGNYTTSNIYTYKYEFGINTDETIKLINLNDGLEFKIIDINELDILPDDDEIFDPEKITEEFDPSVNFENYTHVFLLEQAVFPKIIGDMSNHIFRCIERIEFITKHRLCNSIELIRNSKENLEDEEFSRYQLTDKIYFSLDPKKEELFLAELSVERLFDHDWLSNYIPNYYEAIYRNT